MIMVHLTRSLLTNLNSMIAIEAKYVDLCKYTVTYVGLNYLQRSSAVAGGGATHVEFVDPTYVSPGDAWFDGSAVATTHAWACIARIGACVRKCVVAPFSPKFRMERVSPCVPTISQRVRIARNAERCTS